MSQDVFFDNKGEAVTRYQRNIDNLKKEIKDLERKIRNYERRIANIKQEGDNYLPLRVRGQ